EHSGLARADRALLRCELRLEPGATLHRANPGPDRRRAVPHLDLGLEALGWVLPAQPVGAGGRQPEADQRRPWTDDHVTAVGADLLDVQRLVPANPEALSLPDREPMDAFVRAHHRPVLVDEAPRAQL